MRKILLVAAVLCSCTTIGAQGLVGKEKMSPWLKEQYTQHQKAVQKNGGPLHVNGRRVQNYVLALVQSTDGDKTIRQQGGVVWQDFGDGICAAFLPVSNLGEMDQAPGILRMEANPAPKLMNDTSAVILGVDKVWDFENTQNSSLPPSGEAGGGLAFTGKGVIAGVMDISFDFTHPAFRNEDGTSRIQWYWEPAAESDDPDALGVIYDSPEKVLAAQCSHDAILDEPHGTHVMGSMAGGGLNGRYTGMAPEADIMGASAFLGVDWSEEIMQRFAEYVKSHLEDWAGMEDAIQEVYFTSVYELVELKKIFDAADAAGKPCVVNWSFGAPLNFGSDYRLFEVVLNQMLGPGHILVVAAGNAGHLKTYVHKEANEPLVQDLFFNHDKNKDSGATRYIYELELRVNGGYDPFINMELTIEDMPEPFVIDLQEVVNYMSENEGAIYTIEKPGMEISVEPLVFPEGTAGIGLSIEAFDEVYTHPEKMKGTLRIDNPIALDLNTQAGGINNLTLSPYSHDDSRGCNQYTIGFPGDLERVITVGAMHHRSSFTNYQGESTCYKKMGSKEGHLVSFSSCGPTLDGRVKPDVVAPGHNIISALSSFYKKNNSEEETKEEVDHLIATKANVFGKEYSMFGISGTSMAAPIASGVIALWLQAKPDLTPEDIMGVIERTSHQPEPEFSGTDKNVYYGWGEIDAYAGLLDILGIGTSIPQLSKHQPKGVKFRMEGNTLYIDGQWTMNDGQWTMNDGQWTMNDGQISVFTTDGRLVAAAPLASGCVTLPAGTPAGVYAVQVGKLGSTLIRL